MNRMRVEDQWIRLMDDPGDPYSEPVIPDTPPACSDTELCRDCRYPSVGFLCRGTDGRCLRSEMKRFDERRDRQHETK